MKLKFYAFFAILLMIFGACKNNNNNSSESVNDEYSKYRLQAEKSPVLETKLFGSFELGMSPQQVDSVFNVWVREGKVMREDEADKTEATIIDYELDKPSIDNYVYSYYIGLPYPFGIKFYPEYIDDKLIGLFCSVKTPKENINPKDAYKYLAEEFENSSRGEKFRKINMEIEGNPAFVFIKDNLEIMFFPQPEVDESSIHYTNLPLQGKYLQQEEQKKKDASML